MNDEFKLQVAPKERDSSLTLSQARSSLIARGRKDAELLAGLEETDTEFELTPESAIGRVPFVHAGKTGGSLEDIRLDAENGDARSQYLVADNPGLHNVEPLTWFRKAAAQGYALAQFRLGAIYDIGVFTLSTGKLKDTSRAVFWYTKAAEQGVCEAAFNLGSIYADGEGLVQDYSKAVEWYRMAADGGLKEAQYNLALMYANGNGLPQDFEEAVRWYRKAAEQGVAEACFNLGVLYERGKGAARDGIEAAKWYLEAAAHSYNYKAEFNIGLKYESGSGVLQDLVEAYKWLHLAVYDSPDTNDVGKYAAVRDRVSAKLTPEKIVEALRNIEAHCVETRDCDGGIFDYAEAEKLYRRAAERGNEWAQCELGLICSQRSQVGPVPFYGNAARDYNESASWLRKAAEQGNFDAQFLLGHAYLKGEGVPQDYVKAHLWFNLASSGSAAGKSRLSADPRTPAATAREEVVLKMTTEQIAEAQRMAREWKPSAPDPLN